MERDHPQLYADLMNRMKTAQPVLHRSMLISEKKRSDERERKDDSEDVDDNDNNSSEQQ